MSDPVDKIMLRHTITGMHQKFKTIQQLHKYIYYTFHTLIKDCHFHFLDLSETLKQRSKSILAALDHGNCKDSRTRSHCTRGRRILNNAQSKVN